MPSDFTLKRRRAGSAVTAAPPAKRVKAVRDQRAPAVPLLFGRNAPGMPAGVSTMGMGATKVHSSGGIMDSLAGVAPQHIEQPLQQSLSLSPHLSPPRQQPYPFYEEPAESHGYAVPVNDGAIFDEGVSPQKAHTTWAAEDVEEEENMEAGKTPPLAMLSQEMPCAADELANSNALLAAAPGQYLTQQHVPEADMSLVDVNTAVVLPDAHLEYLGMGMGMGVGMGAYNSPEGVGGMNTYVTHSPEGVGMGATTYSSERVGSVGGVGAHVTPEGVGSMGAAAYSPECAGAGAGVHTSPEGMGMGAYPSPEGVGVPPRTRTSPEIRKVPVPFVQSGASPDPARPKGAKPVPFVNRSAPPPRREDKEQDKEERACSSGGGSATTAASASAAARRKPVPFRNPSSSAGSRSASRSPKAEACVRQPVLPPAVDVRCDVKKKPSAKPVPFVTKVVPVPAAVPQPQPQPQPYQLQPQQPPQPQPQQPQAPASDVQTHSPATMDDSALQQTSPPTTWVRPVVGKRVPQLFVNPVTPVTPAPSSSSSPADSTTPQPPPLPPAMLSTEVATVPVVPPGADPADPLAGFPESVRQIFAKRGITRMYDWQVEVLALPKVCRGGNLVFSLPTSGGKSLVAEVLLLRAVAAQRSGILVMPFVALVDEKMAALEPYTKALGFELTACAGELSQVPIAGKRFIAICTIEKANSLVNKMAAEGRTKEIGCVVADELHMIGEPGRGPILEMLLTKICVTIPACQIVGMSATLPNLPLLARWLDAELYVSDFRPVTLECFLLKDTKECTMVLKGDGETARTLPLTKHDDKKVALLVNEVVPSGCCLVFCPSKKECQRMCKVLAGLVSEEARTHNEYAREALATEMKGVVSGSLDADFEVFLRAGIAYHHAGMLGEERVLIEEAYKRKVICVLCCTSTLAAGVNLPARRVIIRYPYVGISHLDKSKYLQMCGRAGRAGFDSNGEAYLLCRDNDFHRSQELMRSEIEPLTSKSNAPASIEGMVLDAMATGVAKCYSELISYAERMLYPQQDHVAEDNDSVLAYKDAHQQKLYAMIGERIVGRADDSHEDRPEAMPLQISPFGASVFKSGFTLNEARLLKEELKHMQDNGVILGHDLHMLYYLTPIKDAETWSINWRTLAHLLANMKAIPRQIATMIGISEPYVLVKCEQSDKQRNKGCRDEYKCRRFWCALILSDLLSEMPVAVVSKKFSCERVWHHPLDTIYICYFLSP